MIGASQARHPRGPWSEQFRPPTLAHPLAICDERVRRSSSPWALGVMDQSRPCLRLIRGPRVRERPDTSQAPLWSPEEATSSLPRNTAVIAIPCLPPSLGAVSGGRSPREPLPCRNGQSSTTRATYEEPNRLASK